MEKKKRLTITLSENVLNCLSEIAKDKGLSKSALITVALEEYKKLQNK
ncbi:ribbon-helix-helix domain-containing protein [Lactiplantibacillus pentosus]